MGEARRRKLAGDYPTRDSLTRVEAITGAFEMLASRSDPAVSGITVFPADGSEPVYVSAADAKPSERQH